MDYWEQQQKEKMPFSEIIEEYQESNDIDLLYSDIDYCKWIFCTYEQQQSVGCDHYVCGCLIECNQCKQFYNCKKCHDEHIKNHQLCISKDSQMKCQFCNSVQQLSQICKQCKKILTNHQCFKCQLVQYRSWDAKQIYHCDQCNHCNIGKKINSIHCKQCKKCISKKHYHTHLCTQIENCIVCLEELKETKFSWISLTCRHQIHSICYKELLNQNMYKCPVCKKFMLIGYERQQILQQQSNIFQNTIIKYTKRNEIVTVQCNDCGSNFPNLVGSYNLYFCNTCKLFNCEKTQIAATEQDYIDYIQKTQPDKIQIVSSVDVIKQYFIKQLKSELENRYTETSLIEKVESIFNVSITEQNIDIFENLINSCTPSNFEELEEQVKHLMIKMLQ